MEKCCKKLLLLIFYSFLIMLLIKYKVILGSSNNYHRKGIVSRLTDPTKQRDNRFLPQSVHPRRSTNRQRAHGGRLFEDEGNVLDFELPPINKVQKFHRNEIPSVDKFDVDEIYKELSDGNWRRPENDEGKNKARARKRGGKTKAKSPRPENEPENCPVGPAQESPKPVDSSTMERIKTQNRHLTLTAHKMAIYGPEIVGNLEGQEPTESFKLLTKTGEIFKHYCPKTVIPETYIDNILRTFMVLHKFAQPARTKYLTSEETSWILKLLDKCLENKTSEFVLNGQCADEIIADEKHRKICPPPMLKGDHTKFDVLVDTLFKIFELTHSHCFESFQGFSRVWHRYAMGMEDLFTLPIKQRWVAGPLASNERFWTQLLGPNFIIYNENIEKCVHFYAMNSPLKLRLRRFKEGFTIRYGAGVENIFESGEEG